jgi:hypothetical protein
VVDAVIDISKGAPWPELRLDLGEFFSPGSKPMTCPLITPLYVQPVPKAAPWFDLHTALTHHPMGHRPRNYQCRPQIMPQNTVLHGSRLGLGEH